MSPLDAQSFADLSEAEQTAFLQGGMAWCWGLSLEKAQIYCPIDFAYPIQRYWYLAGWIAVDTYMTEEEQDGALDTRGNV